VPSERRLARDWQRAQMRARQQWIERAFAVLARYAKLPPVWGAWSPAAHYVRVDDQDWLDLLDPRTATTGARVVQLLVPPGNYLDMTAFRRHWNHVMGYPDSPPWRWDWTDGVWLVGHPFALPTTLAMPPVDYGNPALADRVILGQAEDGSILTHDLIEAAHGLIGGKTWRGKSSLVLLYAVHLLSVGRLQALVVLDPKGGEYPELELAAGHAAAWNPATCSGIHVATPDFDEYGEAVGYRPLELAARAVVRETGRRRNYDHRHNPERSYWRQARILLVVDEAADLLDFEDKPDRQDKSPEAEQVRERNRQRTVIARAMRHEAMMGSKFSASVIPAAQSPRREFVAGAVHANLAFKTYLGRGDNIEMGVVFGRGYSLPDPPLDIPGRGVWLNNRLGAPPTDPYLMYQAYRPDLDWLRSLVEGYQPAQLPDRQAIMEGSPNGQTQAFADQLAPGGEP
jgi:hypothetical protein